jgi:hypothetical protein
VKKVNSVLRHIRVTNGCQRRKTVAKDTKRVPKAQIYPSIINLGKQCQIGDNSTLFDTGWIRLSTECTLLLSDTVFDISKGFCHYSLATDKEIQKLSVDRNSLGSTVVAKSFCVFSCYGHQFDFNAKNSDNIFE